MGFITGLPLSIGCAFILYRAARGRSRNGWVWGLIGFACTLIGVASFYVWPDDPARVWRKVAAIAVLVLGEIAEIALIAALTH